MEEHYSSEEEEVYFGSLAESEVLKRRRFLGDNYNSPVTPRPLRLIQASHGTQSLPDVLGTSSTPIVQRQLSAVSQLDQYLESVPPGDSPLDDSDVIILDTSRNSNSVITLSDDESFVEQKSSEISTRDEGENKGLITEPVSECEIEVGEQHYESLISDNGPDIDSVEVKDKSLNHGINRSEIGGNVLDRSSLLNNFETNNQRTSSDCGEFKFNLEKNISSIVQDIDEFIDDSNVLEKSSAATVDQVTVVHSLVIPNNAHSQNLSYHLPSGEKVSETPGFDATTSSSKESLGLLETANITKEVPDNSNGKHSFDISSLSNLEFSLNGVTDSILNISHGSSLPSPPDTHQPVRSMLQKPNLYEDISYDGEQLDSISNVEPNTYQGITDDLHMSVDETDFQRQGFSSSCSMGNSINVSQPSEYKSCPSACSSYSTAYDTNVGESHSTSEQSGSFQNYRDVSTDLDLCIGTDAVSIKSDEENVNEASFEMVIQNRQNSFNGTPVPKKYGNHEGDNKTKVMSKLPVYQSSKSLLRPPQFCVKPDSLKTSSYKFAKQVSKIGSEKTSNRPEPQLNKLTVPSIVNKYVNSPSVKENKIPMEKEKTFTKTPAKISSPKPNIASQIKTSSLTKSKIISRSYLSVYKTPSKFNESKTPTSSVKNTPVENISHIPRAVKSDSKVKRVLTPLSNCNFSEKSAGKSIPVNNRYKNVISPIQAYIRGSPPVSQRKAKVIEEEEESPKGQASKTQTLPKSVPSALQKLKYENAQGQENINPNVIDPSRDTLPCKVLEPALEVFWKEREQPQRCLPKMGEKLTKILAATPKVKCTRHEGRVNESPTSKGILVPNIENSMSSSEIPVADNTHEQLEGRISVRMQKTLDLQ